VFPSNKEAHRTVGKVTTIIFVLLKTHYLGIICAFLLILKPTAAFILETCAAYCQHIGEVN
jgi:hypothetical protein